MKKWSCVSLLVALLLSPSWGERKYRTLKTDELLQMLSTAQADIKEHYYDPSIHGFDIDQRFEQARKEVVSAKSEDEGLLSIAAAVAAVNDSHTSFIPPARPYGVDYGWIMQAIGKSDCFVTGVRPESDAAKKGLKPGDQIVSVNGVPATRQDIRFIEYAYRVIPQSGLRIVVRSPDGSERNLVAMATVIPGQEVVRHSDVMTWLRNYRGPTDRSQYQERDQVLFWKLPDFLVDPKDVDGLLIRTHGHKAVVLDLRGNPGGLTESLQKFIAYFFDHDVKIGDAKTREGLKPEIVASRHQKAFTGQLIVLIDSRSASAAELFARVVQLEKRGLVLGDQSRGSVMRGQIYMHAVSLDRTTVAQYRVEVSTASLVMSDGKSLENVGVVPDETIIPTASDIAEGRDPALARAAELAGIKITVEDAGKIFPVKWTKERIPEID